MEFKSYIPADALKPYVKYFWLLNSIGFDQHVFKTVADGCPGIMFQDNACGVLYQYGKQLPATFLYGQSTKFAELHLKGNFSSIGVFFHPGALKLLFRLDSHLLTDDCLDLDAEARKDGFYLTEQLSGTQSATQKIEMLSAYLLFKINACGGNSNGTIDFAVAAILHSKGNIVLKELYEKMGQSERTFERKFKEYIGLTPKLFTRICKFQATMDQMRATDYDKLSDVAFENQFADQSHFIRTFKEFSGLTPKDYVLNAKEPVENLVGCK